MRIRAVVSSAALLAVVACGKTEIVTPRESASPSTSSSSSPAPAPTARMAYADDDDLWLYDAGSGSVRRLTKDGNARRERMPRFATANSIVYVVDDSARGKALIVEMTISTGATRTLVERTGAILSVDAGAGRIAYLTVDYDKPEPHTLWLIKAPNATPARLRVFPQHAGRGANQGDEIAVQLVARGVLVNDTALDTLENGGASPTAFLIDDAGKDVIPPFDGVFARGVDDSTIVAREHTGQLRWLRIDTTTGARIVLTMKPGTLRAAVSPDARFVAYDNGTAEPDTFLYDLTTKQNEALGRPAVAAVWLGSRSVAVTATKQCTGGICDYAPWVEAGYVTAFSIPQKTPSRITATSTIDADVWLG